MKGNYDFSFNIIDFFIQKENAFSCLLGSYNLEREEDKVRFFSRIDLYLFLNKKKSILLQLYAICDGGSISKGGSVILINT